MVVNCYSKSIDVCLKELSSSVNGLTKEEALLREHRFQNERIVTQRR